MITKETNKHHDLFLVCGAAGGNQGAIGQKVTHLLLKQGFRVRALVRKKDHRSELLLRAGAEVIIGDLLNYENIFEATKGVSYALFLYPVVDGLLTAAANFATAAKSNGVKAVVEISHLHSRASSPSPRTRQHWLCENIFEQAGIGAVHLRCGIFYSNFLAFASEMVPGKGILKLLTILRGKPSLFFPAGDADQLLPMISADDVAEAAVSILSSPEKHLNQTYLLVGELLSFRQLKSGIEKFLGIEIAYSAVSAARFYQILKKRFPANPLLVEHLAVLWSKILHEDAPKELAYVFGQVEAETDLTDMLKNLIGRHPHNIINDLAHHVYFQNQKNEE